jgi:hypothetical protein
LHKICGISRLWRLFSTVRTLFPHRKICNSYLIFFKQQLAFNLTEEQSSRGRERTRRNREARRRDSRGGRETGGPEDGTKKALATDVISEECGKHGSNPAGLAGGRDNGVVVWKPNQTFEKSEERATARESSRPFAFCALLLCNRADIKGSKIKTVQVICAGLAVPTDGGVTVSTGSLATKRHAGVWAPVIARKMIIADHQLAYAA